MAEKFTTAEVAKRFNVTVWNLYDLIKSRKVDPPRFGRSYVWDAQSVRAVEQYAATRKGSQGDGV